MFAFAGLDRDRCLAGVSSDRVAVRVAASAVADLGEQPGAFGGHGQVGGRVVSDPLLPSARRMVRLGVSVVEGMWFLVMNVSETKLLVAPLSSMTVPLRPPI